MKEVVAIAVMDGDKILMGRRRDSGAWTNPGGHMDPGEDRKDAAHRELKEEAGIDIADMTYIGSKITKDDKGERLMIHCYYCHIPTGCPTTMKEDPDEEVHRWHWINIKDGCPQHVADSLHVPMDRNILFQLMECTNIKKSDGLEKGKHGDWHKEGYKIKINKPFNHKDGAEYTVDVESPKGEEAGYFRFNHWHNHPKHGEILHAMESNVYGEHKRKGIASEVYRQMEDRTGVRVHDEPAQQTPDAKKLWSQPNKPFGKSDLVKGAMRRLAPSKGYKDFDPEQQKQYEDWVADYKFPKITDMPESARKRLFHKLHGRTKVRMNPHTKQREFLLHRTHGDWPMDDNRGHKFDYDHSSWSTNQDFTRGYDHDRHTSNDFGEPGYHTNVKHNMMSAWIPEDNISFAPDFGIGPMGKSRDENEVVVHNPERIVHMDKGPFEMAGMKYHQEGTYGVQPTKVYHGIYEGEEEATPKQEKAPKAAFKQTDLPKGPVVHEGSKPIKKSLSEQWDLLKNKKEMLKMYPEEKRENAKEFVGWAHKNLPNMNWKSWAVRHHREKPQDFTHDVKSKLQHFGGSTHLPEVNDVRFEKDHDLHRGMDMLQGAEGNYNKRLKKQLNLVKKQPHTKVIKKFPDGKEWHDTGMEYCEDEGSAMGHCGNKPQAKENDRVLSLRTKHKIGNETLYEPHLTFIANDYNRDGTKVIGEMKGRGNEKPTKKYHDHITGLINKGYVPMGGGYMPENNFHIDDLSQEHKDKIAKKFPMGLAASKTHPIGTKDANKMIKVMQDGQYTMDQREYDEENDEYIDDDGHSEHIPGHHFGNELLNNPGLNKKHIKDIIDHVEKEHYTGYDVEQDMNALGDKMATKLVGHPKTPKSFIDKAMEEQRTSSHYETDYEDLINSAANHPEVSQDDIIKYMKRSDSTIDPKHPKVDSKFIDKLMASEPEFEGHPHSVMKFLRHRPELFDSKRLDKIADHWDGFRHSDLRRAFGEHPEHTADHIKKVMSGSLSSALDIFGKSKHLNANFWDNLFSHLLERQDKDLDTKIGARSSGVGYAGIGMGEGESSINIAKNPNLTPEIVDKAIEYVNKKAVGDTASKYDQVPFFYHSPISEKMIKSAKKDRFLASRLAQNPNLDENTLNEIMHKTKKGRKDVMSGLRDNRAWSFDRKKKHYNEDELDHLLFHHQNDERHDEKNPVPHDFVRDRYYKLKERNKEKRRLTDKDGATLEHLSGSENLAPDDVLQDIVKWGEKHRRPYTEWANEELERRAKDKIKKTASVGHGALGAPTSLVGGATGAYGLKQPVLNPDIEGDGGEERAKTALGNLFGEEDISQMLQGLNKSEVRSEIVSQAAEIIADEIRESLASRMLHERD